MSKKNLLYIAALLIVVVCGFGVPAITANRGSQVPGSRIGMTELTLRITTRQGVEYLPLEPVVVDLTLSNPTSSTTSWQGFLAVGRDVNFQSRDTSGQVRRWEGRQYIGLIKSLPVAMSPGEEVKRQILLDRHLSSLLFPRSGRYELKVEFTYKTRDEEQRREVQISSNPISVDIKEPSGIDRLAYDYLRGPLEEVSTQPDVRLLAQKRQEFVDRFGNSGYAKYVIFQLANTYQTLGENQKAARELCKLTGQKFYYSNAVEKKAYELEAKLRPYVMVELAEDAPLPPRPHPCLRMLN